MISSKQIIVCRGKAEQFPMAQIAYEWDERKDMYYFERIGIIKSWLSEVHSREARIWFREGLRFAPLPPPPRFFYKVYRT
jgi:hypothetical protein